jgi:hypothetical protein
MDLSHQPLNNELERPQSFNDIALRVKLCIVTCFENALRFVEFYGGIFSYPPLEFPLDKLLGENVSFSIDETSSIR